MAFLLFSALEFMRTRSVGYVEATQFFLGKKSSSFSVGVNLLFFPSSLPPFCPPFLYVPEGGVKTGSRLFLPLRQFYWSPVVCWLALDTRN